MSKENRPILPFYANDFLGSTAAMEPAEVGMYIRLLSYQWINGPFPSNFKSVCRLAGIESSDVDASAMLRALLEHKFSIDLAGNYSNKRLEVERAGSFEKDAERKAKAKRAADIRWENERLRKAEAEFEKNNCDNSNFEDATSNAQSNANAYAKDHAKSMLTESETENSIGSIEETSINHHRGVQGGNGKSLSKPTFDVSRFARDFAREYGIAGKIAANERAMAQAVISIRSRDGTITDEALQLFLLSQAKKSKEYDQRRQSHRLNPDTWLDERQYEVDFDEAMANYKPHRKEEKAQIYDRLNSEEPRF